MRMSCVTLVRMHLWRTDIYSVTVGLGCGRGGARVGASRVVRGGVCRVGLRAAWREQLVGSAGGGEAAACGRARALLAGELLYTCVQ